MGEGGQDNVKTAAEWKEAGNEAYKRRDYRGAIEAYTRAIEEVPEEAAYLCNRAAASMMILDYESAIGDCDKAIAIDPQLVKAYCRKGKSLAALGRFDEAKKAYNSGLVHDPNCSAAIQEKAEIDAAAKAAQHAGELIAKGQAWSRANALIDAALKLAPQSYDLKLMKVQCLVKLKLYEEALEYSTSLMRVHAPSKLLYWRAMCLHHMGNLETAVRHLQEAVRGDPDNTEYVALLKRCKKLDSRKKQGDEAFKSGSYQAAIDAYTDCLEVDAELKSFNAKLYNNRATANSKLRRHREAVNDCSRAIELDANYVKAYRRRAESLFVLGEAADLEQCLRDWEEIGRRSSDEDQREIRQKIRQVKVAIKRAKRKDFYKILGVPRDAEEEEIKKAYKRAALKYHPDRHTNSSEEEKKTASEKFRDIAEAYEVLSTPEKKQRYDSGADLDELDADSCGGGHGGFGGVDPEEIFRMFMHGGGGFGGSPFGGMGGGGFGHGPQRGAGGVRFHF